MTDKPTTAELVAWLRKKQAAYNMPATDQLPQFKRSEAMYKAAAERLESLEAEVEAKHVETIDGWDLPSTVNRIDELEAEVERWRKAVDYRWPEGLGWDGVNDCVETLKRANAENERLKGAIRDHKLSTWSKLITDEDRALWTAVDAELREGDDESK